MIVNLDLGDDYVKERMNLIVYDFHWDDDGDWNIRMLIGRVFDPRKNHLPYVEYELWM